MGKPLSRPDCLRKRPRCLGKRVEQEVYMEDCYVPQRSIYDTMRINEHIDQGSGAGEDSTVSSNGTLGAGGTSGSTKRLDERVIFDSLKLTAEAESRSPVGGAMGGAGGGGSVSPSISSTGSGPSLAVTTRRCSQGSDKRDRRSWKAFTPPERPEVSPGEPVERLLPTALTPSSLPLISPYLGSPVDNSFLITDPLPTPFNPHPGIQPCSTRGPLPSPPPLTQKVPQFVRGGSGERGGGRQERRGMWRITDSSSERDSPILDQDMDTVPLLTPLLPPEPEPEPNTCTWPRRLMGRRRTVCQGGVLHKLPILPPLPPLLAEQSEVDEESLRLLDMPSSLLQKPEGVTHAGSGELRFEEYECRVLQGAQGEDMGWEEMLQKVDSLWEETELQGWGPICTGSLGPWPILPPPLGFGGPESPPSHLSSVRGSHDLLPGQGGAETAQSTPPLDPPSPAHLRPNCAALGGQDKEEEEEKISPKTNTDQSEELNSERTRESNPKHGTQFESAFHAERLEYDSDLSSAASLVQEEDKEGGRGGVKLEIRRDSPPLHSPSPENPYSDCENEGGASEESALQSCSGRSQGKGEREQGIERGKEKREERGDEIKQGGAQEEICSTSSKRIEVITSDLQELSTGGEKLANPTVTVVTAPRVDSPPPSRKDSPLPLSPSKHEVRGSGLDSEDADAFVVTDSFVYLAVSALPPFPPNLPLSPLQESAPSAPLLQPRPDPEEIDFLSTDSFVYLAAPEHHAMAGDGSSGGNSPDSDSEGGQSGVDFVLGSTGDSDSDASDSGPDPAAPGWDQWEELEPTILPGLFSEDQSECGLFYEGQSDQEILEPGGLDSGTVQREEGAELSVSASQEERERETPREVEGVGWGPEQFLDRVRVPTALFWETHKNLEPWLEETEALLSCLPSPAIDLETLRNQQDQIRVLKESIAGHQCHVDKLLLIGPMLDPDGQEGAMMRQSYSAVELRYRAIKEGVRGHSAALDEAISQSSQFHDKMEPLLETLERAVQRLRQRPPVAVELEKIREQLAVHRAAGMELDKLLPSYNTLCSRGDDPTAHVPHANPADPASQVVRSQLRRLCVLWEEIRQRAQEREGKLLEVLDLAGKFWAESGALLGMLRDAQDITRKLEDPAVSPSPIRQQLETTKAWRAEVGQLSEQLEGLRTLGGDLITACGDMEKPLVKKTIDETHAVWESLNRTLGERMERLEEAMTTSVQHQDALQGMHGYLDSAEVELKNMPAVGAELCTVRQQIQELKLYKAVMFQQQREMQKLRQQGELLLRKASAETDRKTIQEPLTHLMQLWKNLGDEVTHRQHELEVALLCLGEFQQALIEVESWLSQTHVTLDTLRPISCDPKAIEMELASHQVLKDEVFSHHSTLEMLNRAGSDLLESSPGHEALHLREQLETVNQSWDSLLLKAQERQALLEAALLQAERFHREMQECLQKLCCTERQLSATKPTGGLPETTREQLRQHMELQNQLAQQGSQCCVLLEQGQAMLLSLGGDEGSGGSTLTQQNLALLQNMWSSLIATMDNRRVRLEEAVSLAAGFQGSLQVCVNWLIQAEQTLNMAPLPSLILDTVLLQIEQHKVFVSEVNSHREQVVVLEKVGSQLRSASLEQDEVLISNLLLRVHSRWNQLAKSSLDREQYLEEARSSAKKFQESCGELWSWLVETENILDSELRVTNEPDEINQELAKHEELRKCLCSKLPLYYGTVQSARCMRDKATLPTDTQKLLSLLEELPDKWDSVCAKSMERQQQLEEMVLYSGQCEGALQLMLDWLCWAETQLHEDQPINGDLDLVSHLLESHQVFQRELSHRTGSVQALKQAAAELMGTRPGEAGWVGVLVQELNLRWDRVCGLSVTKQTRLQQALKQGEQFHNAVKQLLVWLSGAGQAHFRCTQPEEAETLQAMLHTHEGLIEALEEKREEVMKVCVLGEAILSSCHPDSITLIRQRVTTLQTRYREVLTWAKQHKQALESSLAEMLNNSILLEELLSWLLWAESTLMQREALPFPHDSLQIKTLIIEHQVFMEEMAQKQTDIDRLTKTSQSKPAETPERKTESAQPIAGGNPRLSQLGSLCQQVWQLAQNRQNKLTIALNRLEELEDGAEFDFDTWRRKCLQWVSRRKCHMMDEFRRMDMDQDGSITRKEFTEVIVGLDFPTGQWEMVAVMDLFDPDGSGHIDYYKFVDALHQSKDACPPITEADKIKDEVTRQVVRCKCIKRFQVEQIGENKYRLGQYECVLRLVCKMLLVQVGHGWMSLNEFLMKYDPCRELCCTPSFPRELVRLAGSREEQSGDQ